MGLAEADHTLAPLLQSLPRNRRDVGLEPERSRKTTPDLNRPPETPSGECSEASKEEALDILDYDSEFDEPAPAKRRKTQHFRAPEATIGQSSQDKKNKENDLPNAIISSGTQDDYERRGGNGSSQRTGSQRSKQDEFGLSDDDEMAPSSQRSSRGNRKTYKRINNIHHKPPTPRKKQKSSQSGNSADGVWQSPKLKERLSKGSRSFHALRSTLC